MGLFLETPLRESILEEYPSVWDVRFYFDPDIVVELLAHPKTPLCPVEVSRFVAQTLQEKSYTISMQYEWSVGSRLSSIVKHFSRSSEDEMPTNNPLPYLYVIFGQRNGKRIPFGSFATRAAAESAVENGSLKASMSNHGLRLSDCDHYIVERWEVGHFLEEPHIKTLTSYDRNGNQMMRFPEAAADAERSMGEVSGRLASILNDSDGG